MTTPIKRNSLADEVAHRLQQQISLGTYQQGQKLPTEPALMQEFGVGRSTIREAVRILANGGVLRVQQGLGTFVEGSGGIAEPLPQRLKRAPFNDLDEVRQLLEQKVAQKAAQHRGQKDIEKIEHYLQKRKEYSNTNQVEACIQADIDFHISIAEASGNSILTDLYKTVAIHLKKHFIDIHKTTGSFRATQQLHRHLFNSIVQQDTQKAWYWAQRITQHRDDESIK